MAFLWNKDSPKLSDIRLCAVLGIKTCPKFKGKNLSVNFSAEIEHHKIGPRSVTSSDVLFFSATLYGTMMAV
jgi:hypothetical protein